MSKETYTSVKRDLHYTAEQNGLSRKALRGILGAEKALLALIWRPRELSKVYLPKPPRPPRTKRWLANAIFSPIYVYVYVYVYMYICIYVYMYICIYIYRTRTLAHLRRYIDVVLQRGNDAMSNVLTELVEFHRLCVHMHLYIYKLYIVYCIVYIVSYYIILCLVDSVLTHTSGQAWLPAAACLSFPAFVRVSHTQVTHKHKHKHARHQMEPLSWPTSICNIYTYMYIVG